jgi:hypothetical protein
MHRILKFFALLFTVLGTTFAGPFIYDSYSPYANQPTSKTEPLILVTPPPNPFDISASCGEILDLENSDIFHNIEIKTIGEGTVREIVAQEPYRIYKYRHIGKIEVHVTCDNGGVYKKTYYGNSDFWLCATDCPDERPIRDLPITDLTLDAGAIYIGDYKKELKADFLDLLADLQNHTIEPQPGIFNGAIGKLPRPIIFVHGLEDEYRSWGVNGDAPDFENSRDFLTPQARSIGSKPAYLNLSLPDVLARAFDLDPNDPENGIYFFNARRIQHPSNPNATIAAKPGWDEVRSQSRDLYVRINDVLTRYYSQFGIDWSTTPGAGIDLIGHSQGGIVIREMFRGVSSSPSPQPSGSANPLNHINQVVTVNTPHFGSSLAAAEPSSNGEFPGLDALKSDFDLIINNTPSKRTLFSADLDIDLTNQLVVDLGLSIAEAYNEVDEADGFIETSWELLEGTGQIIGEIFDGSGENITFKLKGPYLGPYDISIGAGVFDATFSPEQTGLYGLSQSLIQQRAGASHLDPNSPLILDLLEQTGGGYPRLPNGTPVKMRPMYSEENQKILPLVLQGVSEDIKHYCTSDYINKTRLEAGFDQRKANRELSSCISSSQLFSILTKDLKLTGLKNKYFNPNFEQMLADLQDSWLAQGDAVVENSSQKFINPALGLLPTNNELIGYFQEPSLFKIHDFERPWEPVPHLGINIIGGKLKGAALQGKDLFCALYPACQSFLDGDSESFFRLSYKDTPASVRIFDHLIAEEMNEALLNLSGDFSLSPIFVSKGTKAIGIQNTDKEYLAYVEYSAEHGGVLHYQSNSSDNTRSIILAPAGINGMPAIDRSGNTFTVRINGYSGQVWEKSITLNTQNDLIINFLTDQKGEITVAGNGQVSNPQSQLPPLAPVEFQEHSNLIVLHNELSINDPKESRPRFTLMNLSQQEHSGYKVRYYFSSNEGQIPQIELVHPESENFKIVSNVYGLANQHYIEIDGSGWVINPRSAEPPGTPWEFTLKNQDGSDWNHLDDWSASYSIGIPQDNQKIVVYNNTGEILWGREPTSEDLEHLYSVNDPISNTNPNDSTPYPIYPELLVNAIDSDSPTSNMLRPKIQITNTTTNTLSDFHVLLYFRSEPGKVISTPPEDYYTPHSTPRLEYLGNEIWKLDVHFDNIILQPGQSISESEMAVRMQDWSSWNKTIIGVNVNGSAGELWWGTPIVAGVEAPLPRSQTSDIKVEIRNESPWENNIIKPRIRFLNQGPSLINAFSFSINIQAELASALLLQPYFLSGCSWSQNLVSENLVRLDFQCSSPSFNSGNYWPNEQGIAFGLHYANWAALPVFSDGALFGLNSNWQVSSETQIETILTP